jgi:prefoldin subunit 5
MRLFSPSKPSPIVLAGEHELDELVAQNERLRRLAVTLQKRVDALQSRISSALAGQHALADIFQVNAESFERNPRVH